jgi:3-deoxy-D-manno-octulosonate 8-phosphate phosphatase (KDO 8-P phosphatase)
MAARELAWEAIAFVGDDLADLPVLRRVGLPIAVANATDEVKDVAHWITTQPGGHGAVREVIERLLRARGEYEGAVARYLELRGDAA